jgi:8-oxo-dGTP diphosphatase
MTADAADGAATPGSGAATPGSGAAAPGTPPSDALRTPHRPRHPGDGWVDCRCGHRHWGLCGAAGLLLARPAADGRPVTVLLQHRATWSHHGGTWGVPGGARHPDETAVQAALRETAEEAGVDPAAVRVVGEHLLDHVDWSYTTVLAVAVRDEGTLDARPTDDESLAIVWVPLDEVPDRPLLPAFAEAWPGLRETLLAALPVEGRTAPDAPRERE